jgi:hypothetical protein
MLDMLSLNFEQINETENHQTLHGYRMYTFKPISLQQAAEAFEAKL